MLFPGTSGAPEARENACSASARTETMDSRWCAVTGAIESSIRDWPGALRSQLGSDLDLGRQGPVNRALVGNVEQACSLTPVQRSKELDVTVDSVDHRVLGFAGLAVGRVYLRVPKAYSDSLEGPLGGWCAHRRLLSGSVRISAAISRPRVPSARAIAATIGS
jgi:hypothetical protein